jgi:hypothetical protein
MTSDTIYEFKYSATDLEKYDLPLHWTMQANAYAHQLGMQNYKVIAVNSNTLKVSIMPGEHSDELYSDMVNLARKTYDALQSNTPPEGPLYSWECYFCGIKSSCKNYIQNKTEPKKASK